MTYSTANAQQLKSLKGEIFELEVQKIVKTIIISSKARHIVGKGFCLNDQSLTEYLSLSSACLE